MGKERERDHLPDFELAVGMFAINMSSYDDLQLALLVVRDDQGPPKLSLHRAANMPRPMLMSSFEFIICGLVEITWGKPTYTCKKFFKWRT